MARGPQVDIVASPTGARAFSGSGNGLTELSDSLSGLHSELQPLLQNVAKQEQERLGQKAQTDALRTSGKAFGDAVRDGQIEPTQNPWYVQQYKQASAAVSAQADTTQVLADSQTWAERNDPQAYAQRFNEEIGKLGEKYGGDVDSQTGFNSVAHQVTQQALAQNTSYNVQRINAEHQQAMGGLTTTSILSTSATNGGKPTADQVYSSIEPLHKQYIATGGTESDWNMLTINSVVAAAVNSGDSSLLNVLDDPRGGKGALSNISDPTGKPVASFLAQQRYDIDRTVQSKGMQQIQAIQNQVKLRGLQAVQAVWSSPLAADFLQDKASLPQITTFLSSQGYQPQEIQSALTELSKDSTANATLIANSANDAEGFDLFVRANRDGFTPKLEADIAERVRTGTLDRKTADSLVSAATARTNHLETEARSDARQAKSDARQEKSDERRLTVDMASSLKEARKEALDSVSVALQANGDKSLLNPLAQSRLSLGMSQAEGDHLKSHPGDYIGAKAASENYANQYLAGRLARKAKPGVSSTNSVNSRR